MRVATLNLFQTGKLPVMVCNDLAARGLDTLSCKRVIQFDMPKDAIEYLQRVGRVGRLGQEGHNIDFVKK